MTTTDTTSYVADHIRFAIHYTAKAVDAARACDYAAALRNAGDAHYCARVAAADITEPNAADYIRFVIDYTAKAVDAARACDYAAALRNAGDAHYCARAAARYNAGEKY